MAIGGDAQVPCKKGCVCGPFNSAGKINYPFWWYGEQGIFYNFAGGHATPTKCPFTNHGLDFNGVDSFLTDEQGRKILRDGTDGMWSSINLDCTYPPPCGSVTGVGTKLYLNTGVGLPPKMGGILVLHSRCCPNITYLACTGNFFTVLDIHDVITLTHIWCNSNSLNQAMVDKVLIDVEAYGTSNGTINVSGNSIPSAAGVTAAGVLTGRGWNVTKDA